jgi:proteasome-associated ATPase
MKTDRNNDERIRAMVADLCEQNLPEPRKAALIKSLREQMPAEALDRALLAHASELRAALCEASQHLDKLREHIEELLAPPYFPARCLAFADTKRGREAYVVSNGQCRMVTVDEGVGPLDIGTEVLLSQNLNRAIALGPAPGALYGETASLERVLPHGNLLVSFRGETRTVIAAAGLRNRPPQNGALLQLDPSGIFAQYEVPGSTAEEYLIGGPPQVTFADIGGLDAEIQRIQELILLHTRHANVASRYALPKSNAILLAGRMGSGKTMLAQATCRYLGELAGNGQSRWLYVGPGDLKDMYYGNTEKKIKRLFAAAKTAAARDPAPMVVYFEEMDAYLAKRTGGQFNRVHNEVTSTLLAEMDGFDKQDNVWLMGATNRLDALDPAAVRASRFGDNIITFGALRRSGAREIFRKHLPAALPVPGGNLAALVESVTALLYAPNAENKVADIQFRDGTRRVVTAADIASGAEIAKICRIAKERAALREIETGESGLRLEDLMAGVERFVEEGAAKLKPHNLGDYVDGLPQDLDVVKVEPARRLGAARVRAA